MLRHSGRMMQKTKRTMQLGLASLARGVLMLLEASWRQLQAVYCSRCLVRAHGALVWKPGLLQPVGDGHVHFLTAHPPRTYIIIRPKPNRDPYLETDNPLARNATTGPFHGPPADP